MAWNHAPQPEPPGHFNLYTPQGHQLNMETPCLVGSRKIEESDGLEEKSHPALQYYPHDWTPAFWPGSPNFSSQTQKNTNIPGSKVYLTPPNQSPNMPVETAAANTESSRCSSATTQEVGKESNSFASQTMTSVGTQEKTLSDVLEDALDMLSTMEMEQFARSMKQKRSIMCITQSDVSYAVKVLYGKTLNRTTICKFESHQLSYKRMCQIRPFLQRWLEDTEKNEHLHEALAQFRKRKRRTNLDKIAKDFLEFCFMNNPKPAPRNFEKIADLLHVEKDVVHVWFWNRLQSVVAKEPNNK